MPDAIERLEALRAAAEPRQWTGHCHIEGMAESHRQSRAMWDLGIAAFDALPALLACARALKYIATRLSEDCGDHCHNTCLGCMARAALKALEGVQGE